VEASSLFIVYRCTEKKNWTCMNNIFLLIFPLRFSNIRKVWSMCWLITEKNCDAPWPSWSCTRSKSTLFINKLRFELVSVKAILVFLKTTMKSFKVWSSILVGFNFCEQRINPLSVSVFLKIVSLLPKFIKTYLSNKDIWRSRPIWTWLPVRSPDG